jgi:hypothetical protein
MYFGNPEIPIMMMVQNNLENKKFNFRLGVNYFCILHTTTGTSKKTEQNFLEKLMEKNIKNIASD